jgi:hypothetical protein
LEVEPDAVDFSSQSVGDTVSQAVELINAGDTSLEVSAITISGADAAEFGYDLSPPFTVNPGVPVTLNVTFTPASGGTKSALLTISHTGDNPAVSVSLSGEGVSGGAMHRINAGGPEVTTGGVTWGADQYMTGSSTGFTISMPIDGTTDDVLYQSERYGEFFGYSIPVDPGTYTVNLHFAEIYYGAAGGPPGAAGLRVFNVDIEDGQGNLTNYDIFAEVGAATAVMHSFEGILVTDGFLDIEFSATVENAKISAIEIIQSE